MMKMSCNLVQEVQLSNNEWILCFPVSHVSVVIFPFFPFDGDQGLFLRSQRTLLNFFSGRGYRTFCERRSVWDTIETNTQIVFEL